MKKESFVVTEDWFVLNRDYVAGLNRAQAEAIGESYPLKSGWKLRVIGKEITLDQKLAYEKAKGLTSSVRKKNIKEQKEVKNLLTQKETLEIAIEVAKMKLQLKELNAKIRS